MKKLACLILVVFMYFISGCASIMQGDEQKVHINAYDIKTNKLISANCIVSNDEGVFRTLSNKAVKVGRDKDPLSVFCETDTMQGDTVVEGHVNYGYVLADFVLLDACVISCWIDGLTGSWAEYKSMIDVPMTQKTMKEASSSKTPGS